MTTFALVDATMDESSLDGINLENLHTQYPGRVNKNGNMISLRGPVLIVSKISPSWQLLEQISRAAIVGVSTFALLAAIWTMDWRPGAAGVGLKYCLPAPGIYFYDLSLKWPFLTATLPKIASEQHISTGSSALVPVLQDRAK